LKKTNRKIHPVAEANCYTKQSPGNSAKHYIANKRNKFARLLFFYTDLYNCI